MRRVTTRPRLTAVATPPRLEFTSTTLAASMATSEPAPMAMPTEARAMAGASLTPSPTMATASVPCAACSDRIFASLSAGFTSAMMFDAGMPTCAPTLAAASALSPDSTQGSICMRRRRFTTVCASGRSVSPMASHAQTPRATPRTPTLRSTMLKPLRARLWMAWSCILVISMPSSCISLRLPTATSTPPASLHTTPMPGRDVASLERNRTGLPLGYAFSRVNAVIAAAMGCSEASSAA
mmetsp:Transcript_38540/g.120655  ORF Transcript_38540/g.120655 Transcript_38540/m.120655 type:complete len:239 (-) Transcript_38540:2608-3324(-)